MKSEQKKASVSSILNDEIDYMVLVKKLWAERKIVFKYVIIGMVLGLVVAFSSPKEYTVKTTLLPQSESDNNMGGISSLAAMAGFDIDLSDPGCEISPILYPQIIESEPFLLDLMNSKFTFPKVDRPVSLFDYYTKIEKPGLIGLIMKYTIGLPGEIRKVLKGKSKVSASTSDGLIHLTEDQDAIGNLLKNNITLSLNKKEGYLTLTCIFPDALLSAQIATRSQDLLKKAITEYKTKRAKEQLHFFEQRYAEKKKDYEKAQEKLAWNKDRNQFLSTAMAGTGQERLEGEYQIAYSVYSELAKQLENAQIKVKKETPAFVVIKPVVVPLQPTAPKKASILFIFTLLGGVTGVGFAFGKNYIRFFKKKSENDNLVESKI